TFIIVIHEQIDKLLKSKNKHFTMPIFAYYIYHLLTFYVLKGLKGYFNCSLFSLFDHFFHFSCKFSSWQHNTMITTQTFNSYIHTHSNNSPAIISTWMWLFHFHNIIQFKLFVVCHLDPSSVPFNRSMNLYASSVFVPSC